MAKSEASVYISSYKPKVMLRVLCLDPDSSALIYSTQRQKVNSMIAVEIQINDDTLETRHCFTDRPLKRHAGYTLEDEASGWRQVMSFYVHSKTNDETIRQIELKKSESIRILESYWTELAHAGDDQRVIENGIHYTMHSLVDGPGFGGRGFRIEWLAEEREPTICNIFVQGRIPLWIRDMLPDNAKSIECLNSPIDLF